MFSFYYGIHRGSEMSETLLVIISILLLFAFNRLFIITFFIKTDASFYFKTTSILRKNALLTGKDRAGIPAILVDHDTDGKPFSRYDFQSVMFLAKYRSEILGFGSKRDFEASGYYIANTLFPVLTEELSVNVTQEREGKKYVIHKKDYSHEEKI